MSVFYKLVKSNGNVPHDAKMRIVVDMYNTVGMELMGQHIEKATALTTADLIGAFEAVKTEMADQLMLGNRVHLPGLGYFSLSIKGELYEDPKTHRFRLRNPYVRTVNFRPEKQLMRLLSTTKFENMTYRQDPYSMPTDAEVDTALDRLFAETDYIFIGDLRAELNLSKASAYRLARRLEAQGKLHNAGSRYRKMYVRGSGTGEDSEGKSDEKVG